MEKGEIGEIYNIGSDDHQEYTVTQVADILIDKIIKTTLLKADKLFLKIFRNMFYFKLET